MNARRATVNNLRRCQLRQPTQPEAGRLRLTVAELQQKLLEAAHKTPQPEVHVRGDKRSSYEPIGRIVLACQRAGITRVGFITEPPIHP